MAKSEGQREQRGIQSIEVGFRLIRVLEQAGTKLPLKTVAERAGMSPSNAHLYLVSFSRLGLVTQDPVTLRYGLGTYTVQLGLAGLRQLDIVDIARQPMEALEAETALAVYLSVWGNMGPTIVLKFDGLLQAPLSVRAGYVFPLLSTATGNVFLAFLPERETRGVLAREMARHPSEPADVEALRVRVQADGLGMSDSRVNDGYAAISAPVLDYDNRIAGAITALGPRSQLELSPSSSVAQAVREAAARISQLLGSPSSALAGPPPSVAPRKRRGSRPALDSASADTGS